MEQGLIGRLAALEILLAKKKDIEAAKLKQLQAELSEKLQELSALDQLNHLQLRELALPGPGLSNWQRRHSAMRAQVTDTMWQAKAKVEIQKLDLRKAIAQHQAVQNASKIATEDAKKSAVRRADYAS